MMGERLLSIERLNDGLRAELGRAHATRVAVTSQLAAEAAALSQVRERGAAFPCASAATLPKVDASACGAAAAR